MLRDFSLCTHFSHSNKSIFLNSCLCCIAFLLSVGTVACVRKKIIRSHANVHMLSSVSSDCPLTLASIIPSLFPQVLSSSLSTYRTFPLFLFSSFVLQTEVQTGWGKHIVALNNLLEMLEYIHVHAIVSHFFLYKWWCVFAGDSGTVLVCAAEFVPNESHSDHSVVIEWAPAWAVARGPQSDSEKMESG